MVKIFKVGDLVQYKLRDYVVRQVLNSNSSNPRFLLQLVLDEYETIDGKDLDR